MGGLLSLLAAALGVWQEMFAARNTPALRVAAQENARIQQVDQAEKAVAKNDTTTIRRLLAE